MDKVKAEFSKISIRPDIKREIDIIAAREQRPVYSVVSDMLEVYKAVTKKAAREKKPVTPAETIAAAK